VSVSVEHSALVLLFQNRPLLALELLQGCGAVGSDVGKDARSENVDLTQAIPAEYRVDFVSRYLGGKRRWS
jgi:hypothetical protein